MDNDFIFAGECGGCEQQFTDGAARNGQALNAEGFCPNCAPVYGTINIDFDEPVLC